jgi:hypothetical protein
MLTALFSWSGLRMTKLCTLCIGQKLLVSGSCLLVASEEERCSVILSAVEVRVGSLVGLLLF